MIRNPNTADSVVIVIPVLNEAPGLAALLDEIAATKDSINAKWEILVVDDGSSDGSADVARAGGASVLRSSRNLGKSAALQAGFDATSSDIVITMDGDGQDDPAEIPRLIAALAHADLVTGWKTDRQDPFVRRLMSRLFASLSRRASGLELHDFNCGLKAYRRHTLNSIHIYGDRHRMTPILASEAGFDVTEIPVNHRPRLHGKSRYGLERLIRGPLDLISVVFLSRFGQRPLHIFGFTGSLLSITGVTICVYLSYLRLVLGEQIGDRPLLMLGVLLIVSGIQLFSVGLIGEMLLASRRSAAGVYRSISDTNDSRSGMI